MHHLTGEFQEEENNGFYEQFVYVLMHMSIDKLKEKKSEMIEYANENGASPDLIEFLGWAFDRAMEIKQREAVGKGGTV